MPAQCPACSRSNPEQALFCYFDGASLHHSRQGPIDAGNSAFTQPFVFPNGEACGNFNELALACHNHWEVARDLLKQGIWQQYFGGLGRIDLVQLAEQAAQASDLDRGLSDLLLRFPTSALQAPKLAVEPAEFRLGELKPGTDTSFDLVLTNQGKLLLCGTVTSKCDWLVFGEGAGQAQNLFQTRTEQCLLVRVVGSKLRAGRQPLEGELVVESNGGRISVPVRAVVPIRPFPAGALAGACTPREIAAKTKPNPKEAALLFDQGAVRAWYESNGWTWPVQAPPATGKAAVQQFYEALGLVKPPPIEIEPQSLQFNGHSGERLKGKIKLQTTAMTPVYAHGSSDQQWLSVGAAKCKGTMASVPFEIVVPSETAQAELTIRANGNQRFVVGVKVAVNGTKRIPAAVPSTEYAVQGAAPMGLAETAVEKVTQKRTDSPVLGTPCSVPAAPPEPVAAKTAPAVVRPPEPAAERAVPRSFLQSFHSLPKPILFGIYGLLGGLLGALLFGELLWALVQPAGATRTPLQMAASPSVTTYWGASNRFGIKIARAGFDGPVKIKAVNAPPEIQIADVVIPAGSTEAELKINAEPPDPKQLAVQSHKLELHAIALLNHAFTAETTVDLKVEPPPVSLPMTVSPEIRLYEGGSNRFTVKIARQNLEGAVRIDAVNVPEGMKLAPIVLGPDATEGELEVSATTILTNARRFPVQLRATSLERPNVVTLVPLLLIIEPIPPRLTMAVSPQVRVYPGTKNQFGVKIARHGFKGPVKVETTQNSEGIKIPAVVILAGESEAKMEASVDAAITDGLPKTQRVPLRAVAQSVTKVEATSAVDVRIEPLPAALNLAVSPEVGVTQGGKGKFIVKVARRNYAGPVRIDFAANPDGTTFPSPIVPAGQSEIEVEMHARRKTEVGKHNMKATAQAQQPDPLTARGDFILDVKPGKDAKKSRVDIMFLLDITGSMQFAINGVRDGIQRFAEGLDEADVDARIGMVAFRDLIADKANEPMKVLLWDKKAFTADYKAFRASVAMLRADGGGDEPESSMEAVFTGANQAFRPDVTRILILITDASPKFVPANVAMAARAPNLMKAKKAIRDKKINQLHLVIHQRHLPIYQLLQESAKGKFFDLQQAAKGKEGFASLLPALSKEIVVTTAVGKVDVPTAMSAPPPPPPATQVSNLPVVAPPQPQESKLPSPPKVNAVAPPKVGATVEPPSTTVPTLQAVQSTREYSVDDRLQLLIAIALWTGVIAACICFALVVGQRIYLRQPAVRLAPWSKALAGGMLAGLLGGLLGQWFFQVTAGGALWSALSRIPAFGLLGAILGGGMAFFVPNLKPTRGLLGGAIGGVIGGITFGLVSLLLSSVLGRWISAALVGFCIGIMIAFAELAFRRYWLEISFGAHEVRTITLGSAAVTIGGDERKALVYVDGGPPLALSYRIDGDRVVCKDMQTKQTVEVAPGDQRSIGRVTITVCSPSQVRQVGYILQLSTDQVLRLAKGMPLTAEELPGLEAQAKDGMVALVNAHPRDASKLRLRNRSKQIWIATSADGCEQKIEPSGSVELSDGLEIDFGEVQATLRDDRGG